MGARGRGSARAAEGAPGARAACALAKKAGARAEMSAEGPSSRPAAAEAAASAPPPPAGACLAAWPLSCAMRRPRWKARKAARSAGRGSSSATSSRMDSTTRAEGAPERSFSAPRSSARRPPMSASASSRMRCSEGMLSYLSSTPRTMV